MSNLKIAQYVNRIEILFLTRQIVLGGLLALAPIVTHAVPLSFDQMINATTGNNLLGNTTDERTIFFRNVASDNGKTVDAKITTTIKGETDFADQQNPNAENYFGDPGFIPDYRNSTGGPQDDLGFLYYGNGINSLENGISMTLEFFDGTDDLSGSFLHPTLLTSLEIAIYDVDGEASQSEYFFAQKADGLTSYFTGNTPQALVATDLGDSILFEGPGTNFSESDASGAAILYYELTDAVNLSFGSKQTGGPNQNAVFSAIDGDLSLFAGEDFGEPVTVSTIPLSASVIFLLSGIAAYLIIGGKAARPIFMSKTLGKRKPAC